MANTTSDSLGTSLLERCIRDCVPACREQGKVVKSTTLRQSPEDTGVPYYTALLREHDAWVYSASLGDFAFLIPL
jgi:hypothetical protein